VPVSQELSPLIHSSPAANVPQRDERIDLRDEEVCPADFPAFPEIVRTAECLQLNASGVFQGVRENFFSPIHTSLIRHWMARFNNLDIGSW
jgi:hypothetical protein